MSVIANGTPKRQGIDAAREDSSADDFSRLELSVLTNVSLRRSTPLNPQSHLKLPSTMKARLQSRTHPTVSASHFSAKMTDILDVVAHTRDTVGYDQGCCLAPRLMSCAVREYRWTIA